jgi:hypothetical protein
MVGSPVAKRQPQPQRGKGAGETAPQPGECAGLEMNEIEARANQPTASA